MYRVVGVVMLLCAVISGRSQGYTLVIKGGTVIDPKNSINAVMDVAVTDGKVVLVVAGQSTLPQTIFNSTNVLIGVGLLSLPMGIKYAGWICGMIFLALSALVTAYTATILAKCMDVDASLITFADLAFVSYGQKARIATSVLFTLELLAACVALIVLESRSILTNASSSLKTMSTLSGPIPVPTQLILFFPR